MFKTATGVDLTGSLCTTLIHAVVSVACVSQSVLGIDAVMNQRNVVQVETLNFSSERVHLPILSLTLGRNDMVSPYIQ